MGNWGSKPRYNPRCVSFGHLPMLRGVPLAVFVGPPDPPAFVNFSRVEPCFPFRHRLRPDHSLASEAQLFGHAGSAWLVVRLTVRRISRDRRFFLGDGCKAGDALCLA